MGRQIEYYMELDSFKLLVKKAFELGFKIVQGQNDLQICNSFTEITLWNRMYFYLEEAGQLVGKDNGLIDVSRSPVVESSFSHINEMERTISKARIWVSSGFWENDDNFIKQNKLLDIKYSSLMKMLKN